MHDPAGYPGANPRERDYRNRTPLHLAWRAEVCEVLLEADPDLAHARDEAED